MTAAAQRLLVISPVRNEAEHLARVAYAMAGQTRHPDLWVIVDDCSTDDTGAMLKALEEELPFLSVVRTTPDSTPQVKDRLASAAAPRAFNVGLRSVDWQSFTHIAKLDGDTELPPRYFEALLDEFAVDPALGLAGGVRLERDADGDSEAERIERVPERYHVPGALKCYTRECLTAIGGMQERLAWDTIDEVYARMHGFRTRAFPRLIALHHRPWGSADGMLRGRARHGRCAYIVHYPFPWVALRALKTGASTPRGLSGLAYLGGYLAAAVRRTPRVEDAQFRAFFRQELRARIREAISPRLARLRPPRPLRGREA